MKRKFIFLLLQAILLLSDETRLIMCLKSGASLSDMSSSLTWAKIINNSNEDKINSKTNPTIIPNIYDKQQHFHKIPSKYNSNQFLTNNGGRGYLPTKIKINSGTDTNSRSGVGIHSSFDKQNLGSIHFPATGIRDIYSTSRTSDNIEKNWGVFKSNRNANSYVGEDLIEKNTHLIPQKLRTNLNDRRDFHHKNIKIDSDIQINSEQQKVLNSNDMDNKKLQKRVLDMIFHKFVEPRVYKGVSPRPSLIEDLIQTFDDHVKSDLYAWSQASPPKYLNTKAPLDISANYFPPTEYVAPEQTYVSPGQTYVAPEQKYVTPEPTYVSPKQAYVVPEQTYISPKQSVESTVNRRSSQVMHSFESTQQLHGSYNTESRTNPNKKKVTSVTSIVQGNAENSYIVTDEFGRTHDINADEIIEAISKMNENEITELLAGTLPQPNIERSSENLHYNNNKPLALNNFPSVYNDIPYNRKGSDGSDVILVKSSDGDTRLITVKDFRNFATNHSETSNQMATTTELPISRSTKVKQPMITLESLLELYDPSKKSVNPLRKETELFKNPQSRPDELEQSLLNVLTQYLLNTGKLPDSPPSSSFQSPLIDESMQKYSSSVVSPKEISIMHILPYQNTLSLKTTQPPVDNKKGLVNRVTNFFTRFVGNSGSTADSRKSTSHTTDHEQYVQLIMPQADSGRVKEITIPLPKPIHHSGRHFNFFSNSQTENTEREKEQISETSGIPIIDRILGYNENKHNTIGKKENNAEASIASSALKYANIPESVRERVLEQINDKPKFLLPSEGGDIDIYANQPIDRSFKKKKKMKGKRVLNRDKKKRIAFPTGYTYEIPTYFEYPQIQQYPHTSHSQKHKKKHKHKKKNEDEGLPLINLAVLADFNMLDDSDEENSRTLPKIGDASEFIDTRRHRH